MRNRLPGREEAGKWRIRRNQGNRLADHLGSGKWINQGNRLADHGGSGKWRIRRNLANRLAEHGGSVNWTNIKGSPQQLCHNTNNNCVDTRNHCVSQFPLKKVLQNNYKSPMFTRFPPPPSPFKTQRTTVWGDETTVCVNSPENSYWE